jgi:hypothetical protein
VEILRFVRFGRDMSINVQMTLNGKEVSADVEAGIRCTPCRKHFGTTMACSVVSALPE